MSLPAAGTTLFAQLWHPLTSGITSDLRDVHFHDASHGWAVGYPNMIIATVDGGLTWVQQTSTSTNPNLTGVFATSPNICWITGKGGNLLRTVDGGTTWTTVDIGSDADLNQVTFPTPGIGYVVGGSGTTGRIFRTIDGGDTWTSTTVDREMNDVHFVSPSAGWACGSRGVIHRTTNGVDWVQQTTAGPNQLSNLACIQMLDANEGWAGGNPNAIKHTTNGGTTWTDMPSGTVAGKMGIHFFSSQEGWAITTTPLGGGFPLRKTTDGSTWTTDALELPTTLNSIYFLNNDLGWAVGGAGTIVQYGTSATSVHEARSATTISAVPNPATDRVEIISDASVLQVDVLTLQGKPAGPGSTGPVIDVSSIPAGAYLLRVRTARKGPDEVLRLLVQ